MKQVTTMGLLLLLALVASAQSLNPNVTQETIRVTICKPNWTALIRPNVAYTNALKRKQMLQLGLPGRPSDYEEDHIIPLAVGGHPRDPQNLRPQLWAQARKKDIAEVAAHRAVCSGKMSLKEAQLEMLNWKE